MKNKKEVQKEVLNDLFSDTSVLKENNNLNIENTLLNTQLVEEKKKLTKKRTYNLPIDILEDMEKIVYIDRDIKDNTELLIMALRNYLNSKERKVQLEEYNKLKNNKI